MIRSRTLCLSLVILALAPIPLAAQQAIDEKTEPPGQQTTDGSAPASTSSKPEATTPDGRPPDGRPPDGRPTEGRPPPTTDDSPFDYRSSEKISEDLSVSFPVDI